MALVLPNSTTAKPVKTPTSRGGGSLILPGSENAVERANQNIKIGNLQLEQRQFDQAANRSTASRFLEELGVTAKNVGQGIARSFMAVAQGAVAGDLTTPFVPQTTLEKTLFGDKPVSYKTIGEETAPLLQYVGVSRETANNFALPIGVLMAGLDVVPGVGGKGSLLKRVSKDIAGSTDEKFIKQSLQKLVKGDGEAITKIASGLRNVSNAADVTKIINASVKDSAAARRVPSVDLPASRPVRMQDLQVETQLRAIAKDIETNGLSREAFNRSINDALRNAVDSPERARALQVLRTAEDLDINPGQIYEVAVRTGRGGAGNVVADIRRTVEGESPRKITKTETSLLKERIRNINKGFKEGRQVTRKEIYRLQSDVAGLIQRNLPVAARGALLKAVRDANHISKFDKVLETISKKIIVYDELTRLSKELGSLRSKVAFLKKVAELNSTAIRDVKKSLGLDMPIRKMNPGQLDRVVEELKTRLKFKREQGLLKRVTPPSAERLSEEQIDAYVAATKGIGWRSSAKMSIQNAQDTARKVGDIITIPSEALRAIGAEPVLFALRKMGHNARVATKEGEDVSSQIIEKLGLNRVTGKRISERDYIALDLAMKNGATETVMEIADRYGVRSEFEKLRTVLDDVFKRSNEVGLEVDYRRGYFPRAFKDDAATRKAVTEIFQRDYGDVLAKAYSNFTTKMGRVPTEAERWKILNNLMRGFKQEGITLSKTGSFKERIIDTVTPELARYYKPSFAALQGYFESANNLIESRRFFGKELGVDIKNVPAETQLEDIVGVAIDRLVASGRLNPNSSERLREILQARFRGGEMNPFLQVWKNASYLSLMGDVFSAVTQIGDFEKVMYRAGLRSAAPAIWRSVFNPGGQEVRLADLGFDRTIAQEMSNDSRLARAVGTVFKLSGLNKLDRLGKESFINGTLQTYRRAIRSGDERFLAPARRVLGDKADRVFADIENGTQTNDVRFLLSNELMDYFPVSLEEVPLNYLRSPNGRIFYTMKTFTTKQLNTYRREIFRTYKTDKVQATKNAARLIGFFVVMNMTADEIKSFIRDDEDKTFQDKLIDNMLKVIGFNRYSLDRAQQSGFGRAVVEQLLPPTTFVDDAVKDFNDVFIQGKDTGLRSTKNVPLAGELYYWWFGRGAGGKETSQSSSSTSSEIEIPSVEIPEIEIPEITI